MKTVLKAIGILVGVLWVLAVGAAVAISTLFDPNDYRDELQTLAQEQGFAVQLRGDISWRWWPRLGLSVSDIVLGEGDEPLLKARQLSGQVAIAPLFRGQIQVQALEIDGAQVVLIKDKTGLGNWEALTSNSAGRDSDKKATATASSAEPTAGGVSLAIDRLLLSDTSLRYRDLQQGTDLALNNLQLDVTQFNLQGNPTDLTLGLTLELEGQRPLVINSHGSLRLQMDKQALQASDLTLRVSSGGEPLVLALQGNLNWQTMLADVTFAMQTLDLADWLKAWQQPLPEMAAADALEAVSATGVIHGENGAWQLKDLSLQLDQTRFSGKLSQSASGAIKVQLKGDTLDLDRYLPKPVAGPAPVSGKQAAAATSVRVVPLLSEEPLDLTALQTLDASLQLQVDELRYRQLPVSGLQLKALARNGQLQLQQLSAKVEEGSIDLTGTLTSGAEPALTVQGQLQQLPLQTLLSRFADEARLKGNAGLQLKANTRGHSLRQWQQQVQAEVAVKAQSLTLAEVDVERSACELASLINQEPSPELAWKGLTQLQEVGANLQLAGERLTVADLQAGVENLQVKGKGTLQLDNGRFDFPLDVAFVGTADPARDCQVRDRWRNRDLPLRCKGELHTLSARSCLPDRKRVDDLLRDELKEKASEKLQQKLEKKLGTEKGKAVESLLKGLFQK